jgi:hypothetical protein
MWTDISEEHSTSIFRSKIGWARDQCAADDNIHKYRCEDLKFHKDYKH